MTEIGGMAVGDASAQGLAARRAMIGAGDVAPLRSHWAALATWLDESEHSYLAAGDVLQRAHERLFGARSAMLEVAGRVLGTAAGGPGGFDVMAGCAAQIRSLRRQRLEALVRLESDVRAAEQGTVELATVLRTLEHLARIGSIANAGLEGHGSEFASFIEDVAGLVARGRATTLDLLNRLRRMAAALGAAIATERRWAPAQDDALAGIELQLQALEGCFRTHQTDTALFVDGLKGQFDELGHWVAEAVSRLQFQDACRQRLEHVANGIEMLEALEGGSELPQQGLADATPAQLGYAVQTITRIERAQLEDLATQTANQVGALRVAMLELARTATRTHEHLASFARGRAGGGAGVSFLAELDTEVRAIELLLAEHQKARESLDRPVEVCTAEAREMAEVVDSFVRLEEDLRLAGLNATCKSARLGSHGAAMRVVAQAIQEQAAAIKAGAVRLIEILRAVLSGAVRLRDEFLAGSATREGELRSSLREKAATLALENERVDAVRAHIQRSVADLPGELRAQEALSQLEERGRAAMLAAAAALRELATGMASAPTTDRWDELDRLLERRYTMASERALHRGGRAAAAGAAEPTADADDLSDILF